MTGLPPQRPDQAISPPPTVLAPGGAAGIFRGRLVIIFGDALGVGLFVYNPSPAAGKLADSISAEGGEDGFGNPVGVGFSTYTGNTSLDSFMSLTDAGLQWGTIQNLPTGTGTLTPGGPTSLRIQDGFVATDPTTGNTNEAWHSVTLDTGWSGTVRYKLLAEQNVVYVQGAATHAAFSTGTNLASGTHALPSEYWPTGNVNIGGTGIPGRAGLEITTAGVLIAEANGTSCTEMDVAGLYPLD